MKLISLDKCLFQAIRDKLRDKRLRVGCMYSLCQSHSYGQALVRTTHIRSLKKAEINHEQKST